jgi:hypothetical protein
MQLLPPQGGVAEGGAGAVAQRTLSPVEAPVLLLLLLCARWPSVTPVVALLVLSLLAGGCYAACYVLLASRSLMLG